MIQVRIRQENSLDRTLPLRSASRLKSWGGFHLGAQIR
jgi:hypothetical protein